MTPEEIERESRAVHEAGDTYHEARKECSAEEAWDAALSVLASVLGHTPSKEECRVLELYLGFR